MAGSTTSGSGQAGRHDWVDIAKALSIALVVMMHSTLSTGEALGGEGFLHPVVAFAQPFRVPLFFLVAGLFLARAIDLAWRDYLDRRVLPYVYFYLLWLVIQSLFKWGQVSNGSLVGFGEHLLFSLIQPFATLWFVQVLAAFAILTKLLRPAPPLLLLAAAAALEILPVRTEWLFVREVCDRYVYFVAGYLFAPHIFRFADLALRNARVASLSLMVWAAATLLLTQTPAGLDGYATLAALPFASLVAGAAGVLALVALSAFLARGVAAQPLLAVGRRSLTIYLLFFLPMAVTRILIDKLGLVEDVGLASLAVTLVAFLSPLLAEPLIRAARLTFLIERPAWAFLPARRRPALQPAE